MAASVVVRESSVLTVTCLPCTVTVPALTAMEKPPELMAELAVTAAPTSAAPSCLAEVASWKTSKLYSPEDVPESAVAVVCVSLLVTLRVSKKDVSFNFSDTVLRDVSSVFRLVKAAFLARTPACSVRIRRCGARSTLVSCSTMLFQSKPEANPDTFKSMLVSWGNCTTPLKHSKWNARMRTNKCSPIEWTGRRHSVLAPA